MSKIQGLTGSVCESSAEDLAQSVVERLAEQGLVVKATKSEPGAFSRMGDSVVMLCCALAHVTTTVVKQLTKATGRMAANQGRLAREGVELGTKLTWAAVTFSLIGLTLAKVLASYPKAALWLTGVLKAVPFIPGG